MNYVELLHHICANQEHIIKDTTHIIITDKRSYVRNHGDYNWYATTEKELQLVSAMPAELKDKFTEIEKRASK